MLKKDYVIKFRCFLRDLEILMGRWPLEAEFDSAKVHAEQILSLIAGQIEWLECSSVKLNPVNLDLLRNELTSLIKLIPIGEADHPFHGYSSMLEDLASEIF